MQQKFGIETETSTHMAHYRHNGPVQPNLKLRLEHSLNLFHKAEVAN
ncbi:MAG: hypothetical protein ABI811_21945 [Acidobacteriota bacterium]